MPGALAGSLLEGATCRCAPVLERLEQLDIAAGLKPHSPGKLQTLMAVWAQMQPRPATLLQKLLAKDIHTERSHLLQAFRFFVNNDFLLHASHTVLDFPAEPAPLPPEFDFAGAPSAPRVQPGQSC